MTRFFFARPMPPFRAALATTSAVMLIAVALSPSPAQAWGAAGHRLIARLAEAELSPQARAEAARLLRGEPDPTLAGVSNWADNLRDGDDPSGLGRLTARWHYINMAEDDCRYAPPVHCPNGDCVIAAIERQRALLADRRQPDAVRAQALKFLVHFVGDAHQPLHAGFARDRGGNTVQLQWNGQGTNLHRIWDSEMIATAGTGERRTLKRLQGLKLPATASATEPTAWAEASCRIVRERDFYPTRASLGPSYFVRWRPVTELQLRLAGHRLATLLNRALRS